MQWLDTEFSLIIAAIPSLLPSKLFSIPFLEALEALLSLLRDFFVFGDYPGLLVYLADFLGRDFPFAVFTYLMLSTDLITS